MPKLSIVMPTYNGERYLPAQVDSILAQDDDDFELIITDDGSSDGTREVCNTYAARDKRIRIIPSTGNLGQNNRLVQLIDEARGAYVAISDQDDRWAPDRNTRLFAALGDAAMAMGRSELIDAEGELKGCSLLEMIPPRSLRPGPDVRLQAFFKPMFSAHAAIARREMMTPASFASLVPFDRLLGLEALFSSGLAYVDDAIVYHRIHENNQVNSFKDKPKKSGFPSLRWALMFREPARLQTWLLFDALGRSTWIDSGTRSLFKGIAQQCYTIWFSEWRSLRTDGGLFSLIMRELATFSASPTDLDQFSINMKLLTQPLSSKIYFSEVARRLRAQQ